MDEEIIKLASFIKSSKNRQKVVFSLYENVKIPSEIAEEHKLRLNYISMILKELKEKHIVECLNENSKRGRLYRLTKEGNDAVKFIK